MWKIILHGDLLKKKLHDDNIKLQNTNPSYNFIFIYELEHMRND
jgi:hypothetical protein